MKALWLVLMVVFIVGCCPCKEYHYYYIEKEPERYHKWHPYLPEWETPEYKPIPLPPYPDEIWQGPFWHDTSNHLFSTDTLIMISDTLYIR